ncbi:MAG: c-type cytochrome [Phycisphaerales bacterium]|nr:c-type cytochrome [Phycisphaerales bacterium]
MFAPCVTLLAAAGLPGVPTPFTIELFAKEPLVADPVAFAIDSKGRFFVAESERQERGIEDNRSSKFWLMDDLTAQTVADRLAYYEKWEGERKDGMDYYRAFADRVRRIADTDGNGIADHATSFSRDFRNPLDGTGAGVLVDSTGIYYTCIPDLVRFHDADDDGIADTTETMFTGFGVRTALRGHDMHGLIVGPDGLIYWSIGDRGYRVATREGTTLADPKSGAVFRCRPDGSALELFATGLRNPQELAFNEYGDLFTGDNNSDGGDRARFVYVMDQSETGWDMNYQTLEKSNQRGPWNQEGIWHLRTRPERDYPAWTLPPLAHVGSGPSGLAYAPGTGMPREWDGLFFMSDFLGSESHSNVLAIAAERDGAGYKVTEVKPFVTEILTTDVAFGPDSRFYVSAWGGGWYSTGKGSIYAVWDPAAMADPAAVSARALLSSGFDAIPIADLIGLLGHADMRVRQGAQFALASMGSLSTVQLLALVQAGAPDVSDGRLRLLAQVHALWALSMQARAVRCAKVTDLDPLAPIVSMLDSEDSELRAQAARVMGDAVYSPAVPKLVEHILDPDTRVRAACAIASGRIARNDRALMKEAVPALTAALWENDNSDPYLRHALVVGLADCADTATLAQLSTDEFPSVRLGVLLAMRRQKDGAIQRFLFDPDIRIGAEAARAIWDVPIPEAFPALAAASGRLIQTQGATQKSNASAVDFLREVWKGASAKSSKELETSAVFARASDESAHAPEATGFSDYGNNYLQRLSGTITAPEDGEYRFFLCSDDDSVLFLETEGSPASRRAIARVDGYAEKGQWEGDPVQVSETIALTAGTKYRLEARHFQGGGGNHLAIGWRLPSGALERPIGRTEVDPSLLAFAKRTIAANLMVAPDGANALAAIAGSTTLPGVVRSEALEALGEYTNPPVRDRVHGRVGMVAPKPRSGDAFMRVATMALPAIATGSDSELRARAIELATKVGVALDQKANLEAVLDATRSAPERIASLNQLGAAKDSGLATAVDAAIVASDPDLRISARQYLVSLSPSRALSEAQSALTHGTDQERQSAVALLGAIAASPDALISASASKHLDSLLGDMDRRTLAAGIRLDLIETALTRGDPRAAKAAALMNPESGIGLTDALAPSVLEGGSIAKGRDVAFYNSAVACMRCHAIAGVGGHAGPALDGVGSRLDSRAILESIVEPQLVISAGFATPSAMPAVGPLLTPRELRDLVAYISSLKSTPH